MSTEIRFHCPNPKCKAVMAAPVDRAGKKTNCLKCGQRLQIPFAEHAKTILASGLGGHEQGDPPPQPAVTSALTVQVAAPAWYYTKDGKSQFGPFSWDDLQALAKSGQVLSTDYVWQQGMTQWAAASTFENLQSTPKLLPARVAPGRPPPLPARKEEDYEEDDEDDDRPRHRSERGPEVVHRYHGTSKSSGIAVILEILPGFFIQTFGIGHMYAGNVGLGLVFMFGYWFVAFLNLLLCIIAIGFCTWPVCWIAMMILSPILASSAASKFKSRAMR